MCVTPIQLKKEELSYVDNYFMQEVPCGRCIECRKLHVNSWYVRLKAEYDNATSARWVTLTYDDEHLSYYNNYTGEVTEKPCLNYADVQNFMKKYRRDTGDENLKYYIAGEYGEKSGRPHYHAILFNFTSPDKIQEAWKYGNVAFFELKDEAIYYTLKYSLKRATKIKKNDDGRSLEKALMSKGLGMCFLTAAMRKHFTDDVSRPVTMLGNKKLPLPRYYREKLFDENQKSLRRHKLKSYQDDRYEKKSDPHYTERQKKKIHDTSKKLKDTD